MCECLCCADGTSDGCTGLDDSVSEEDGSFEELTEGTPYLQPEVDLSTLNQVSNQTRAHVYTGVCAVVATRVMYIILFNSTALLHS